MKNKEIEQINLERALTYVVARVITHLDHGNPQLGSKRDYIDAVNDIATEIVEDVKDGNFFELIDYVEVM